MDFMKIYTKTGDKGTTGITGGRIAKDSIIIKTVGELDGLNSNIGYLISLISIKESEQLKDQHNILLQIQNIIFNVGSILSGTSLKTDFNSSTKLLENQIDLLTSNLDPLQNFILPGGSLLASQSHICRAVCRRAEISIVEFKNNYLNFKPKESKIDSKEIDSILKYINRLSDYFFTLARHFNNIEGVKDIIWNKNIN